MMKTLGSRDSPVVNICTSVFTKFLVGKPIWFTHCGENTGGGVSGLHGGRLELTSTNKSVKIRQKIHIVFRHICWLRSCLTFKKVTSRDRVFFRFYTEKS